MGNQSFLDEKSTRQFAVVLGTNEIASAIAVALHRGGWGLAMSHDSSPPVVKRGMAFHDVLFGDPVTISGITGEYVENGFAVLTSLSRPDKILVTPLGLLDLLVLRRLDILVDARLQTASVKPDLRNLARVSVGVGPGFARGVNCDVAVPTMAPLYHLPSGRRNICPSEKCSGRGSCETAKTKHSGRWRTAIELGSRIFRGFPLGHVNGAAIQSPVDGIIVGIIRDGTDVVSSDTVSLIETRVRSANWQGMDPIGRVLGKAIMREIKRAASSRGESVRAPGHLLS